MATAARTAEPEIILERFRLGELPDTDARRIERERASDPVCAARLQAIDDSDADLARGDLLPAIARHVQSRLPMASPTPPRRRVAGVLALGAVTTVAIVGVFVVRGTTQPAALTRPDEGDGDRAKGGGASLVIYRKVVGGSERLANDAAVQAGDELRLGYVAGGHPFGTILSIDGRGVITMHLPLMGDRASTLDGVGRVLLDHAYELDAAPSVERFYFVTGDAPFAIRTVLEAARLAAAAHHGEPPERLALPSGLAQFTMSVRKESRDAK